MLLLLDDFELSGFEFRRCKVVTARKKQSVSYHLLSTVNICNRLQIEILFVHLF